MSSVSAVELTDVYSRYCYGVDNGLADVIASCFTPEASLEPVGRPPTVGREAITDRLLQVADRAVVHHAFNIVVLGESSDELNARADFTMTRQGVVIATGHYDDYLTHDPETGWVFARRVVTYIWRAVPA